MTKTRSVSLIFLFIWSKIKPGAKTRNVWIYGWMDEWMKEWWRWRSDGAFWMESLGHVLVHSTILWSPLERSLTEKLPNIHYECISDDVMEEPRNIVWAAQTGLKVGCWSQSNITFGGLRVLMSCNWMDHEVLHWVIETFCSIFGPFFPP